MSGSADDAEAAPCHPLFGDVDRDDRWSTFGMPVEAARFGDRKIGRDRCGVMVGNPPGPVRTAGFFVGDSEHDEITSWAPFGLGQPPEGDRHRSGQVQHVDRTAAPNFDLAVITGDQLPAEGVMTPTRCRHWNDIGMAHETQRRCCWVGALQPGDE